MAVRRPHHGDIDSDTVEPDDPVRPRSLDGCLAFQLQTEIDEERDSSREVVDNDTDIGHFVNEKAQVIPGIQDTHTITTFKAFGTG